MNTTDPYLYSILDRIKEERKLDFSLYRERMLSHRVMARVRWAKLENFRQYLAYLLQHPREMDLLVDAMTINVTEFFRNAAVFEAIERKVLPALFETKRRLGSNKVKVWSCGCSSGEEAYSVLMLIAEYLGPELARYDLTIYGTDIDSQSLAKAREGVYEESQFRNLSRGRKALIAKYFYDLGNKRYWIREKWPAYMKFSRGDILADRPPAQMDLILCRNVFIYFSHELQDRILEKFQGALAPGGFLVQGNVESIFGPVRDKFAEFDNRARIYTKK